MRSESDKLKKLAQHLFPSATSVTHDTPESAFRATQEHLAACRSVADAVLVCEDARCRVDFVEPDGAAIRLYCVVPKAVSLEKHGFGLEFSHQSGYVRKEWRDHFEMIAYRVWIAQQLLPGRRVIPFVVVPVVGVSCSVEGLHPLLSCDSADNPDTAEEAKRILRTICVSKEVAPLVVPISAKVEALKAFLANPAPPEIGYRCKKCEFKVPGVISGYDRCWGVAATITPHMFDLTYMYFISDGNGYPVANRLAREGRVSMFDIPNELITGDYATRQRMQIAGTAGKREIIEPALREEMAKVQYPLIFLDIETLRSLIPAHRGAQVNGLMLFQFSAHVRASTDAALTHLQWLNMQPSDPNQRFLGSLRAALGDSGTVCIWTRYEEVSFRELLTELIAAGVEGPDFDWLRGFLLSGRMLDMNDLCFRHYFHPKMKGRTSIKSVLPAVWSEDSPVRTASPYARYTRDPYSFLKQSGAVGDGCAAMEAYLAMQEPAQRQPMSEQLLQYCEIDTLAMAFVWDYWWWRLADHTTQNTVVS